jgi:DNA-binding CsgD family transcriptional regulator
MLTEKGSLLADELEHLYMRVKGKVPLSEIGKSKHRNTIDTICNDFNFYVAIVHLPSLMPVYFCPKGLQFLGMKDLSFSGLAMTFYQRFFHSDNGNLFNLGINHFWNTPDELFPMTFKVKHSTGEWRWIYGISRLLTRQETGGRALHTISILCDMEEVFEKYVKNYKNSPLSELNEPERVKFTLLTSREKEVLRLIAMENTAEQIADIMNLSEHTIHSHRKNLLKKLDVKTSVGLARYAVLFGL